MKSFREYVRQEKMLLREKNEDEKRRKIDHFETLGNIDKIDIINPEISCAKIDGLTEEMRSHFSHELSFALTKKFCVISEKIESIACKTEYAIFCSSFMLCQYKFLIFQKIADIENGVFNEELSMVESALNSIDENKGTINNISMIEVEKSQHQRPLKFEEKSTRSHKLDADSGSNKKISLAKQLGVQRLIHPRNNSFVNFSKVTKNERSVCENGQYERITSEDEKLTNLSSRVRIISNETVKLPVKNSHESPFIPIEYYDKNITSSKKKSKSKRVLWDSCDNSLNILDIEKDAESESAEAVSTNEKPRGSVDLASETLSAIPANNESQDGTVYFSAESFNAICSLTQSDSVEEIANNNVDKLLSCKKKTFPVKASKKKRSSERDTSERSLTNSSAEICYSPGFASPPETNPTYSKDEIWKIIMGPLRLTYNLTHGSKADNEQKNENNEPNDLFANW